MELNKEGVGAKLVSLLCALVLAVGLMPAVALADDGDESTETETATTVTVDGVDYTTYDVDFEGTGDYSGTTWSVLGTMVYKYFGYDVYVSEQLSDGSYNIVVYFGGESGYSEAIEDFTVYTDSTNSTTDYTVSSSNMSEISDDPVYVFNVDDPSETIYCYLYIGGSMGMGVTFSIDVDWTASGPSAAESYGYTLYYKCADSTSSYGGYFGHFVDGEFESGEVDVVANDDGTYTLTIVADGTSSMLTDVYLSFDEDVTATSSTDDAGYITCTLTLDSLTETIDFTFGYTVSAMNMSMSHAFQMVLDGGTWSGHDYVAGEADENGVVTYTCSICSDAYSVYPFTLYYNAADSTSAYGGYFGHFVDGEFESGSVEVVSNDDGTYTLTIVADGTSSMLTDVYLSFDEDVAATSSTDDAGYITCTLTLDSLTETIDFTFGYTVSAMNMSMSHAFQLVLAGGSYSSDDSSEDDESDDDSSEDSGEAATGDYTVSFVQSDGETASMMASYIEDATVVANDDGSYTISFSLTETGASMISSVSYDGSELAADDSGAYSITVSSIDELIPVSMYVSMMGSSVTAYISVEAAASDDDASGDDGATGDGDGSTDSGSGDDGATGDDASGDDGTTGEDEAGDESEAFLFDDVQNESSYYYEAVYALYDKGYITGYDETTYGVGDDMTRVQVVNILYRMAGSPDATYIDGTFSDVSSDKYYASAVAWAYEAGVTTGTEEGEFLPNDSITRQEMFVMVARYINGGTDVVASDSAATLSAFTDAGEVNSYAEEAVAWCVENGLVTGTDSGEVNPQDELTREMGATVLYRGMDAIEALAETAEE